MFRGLAGDLPALAATYQPQSAAFFHNRAISDNNKQSPTTLFTLSVFLSHPRREHLLASLPELGVLHGSADRSPSRERPSDLHLKARSNHSGACERPSLPRRT